MWNNIWELTFAQSARRSNRRRATDRSRSRQVEGLESRVCLTGLDWYGFAASDVATEAVAAHPAVNRPSIDFLVRLEHDSAARVGSLREIDDLLSGSDATFDVVRGIGFGTIQIRTTADARVAGDLLESNPHVALVERVARVAGQVIPDDPDFSSQWSFRNTGEIDGIPVGTADADINAPAAWDALACHGDTVPDAREPVLVAVLDSGVDVAHPDLYERIWINQAEIPEAVRQIDPDGFVTIHRLNNDPVYRHLKTDPASAGFIADSNGNSYIDAIDVLQAWSDGEDNDRFSTSSTTEHSEFVDDLIGWDFTGMDQDNTPVGDNQPDDEHGHGTHVAGVIAASANNGQGIAGLGCNTYLVPVKFLGASDSTADGSTVKAQAAINYLGVFRDSLTQPMVEGHHSARLTIAANAWVLDDAGGDVESDPFPLLREAIAALDDVLFVFPSGNGDALGDGFDIDASPVYPASFSLDNQIIVASSNRNDSLSGFSNYGPASVDLVAPGDSIYSTVPGDGYASFSGTSMAVAHVAGAAALVLDSSPAATAQHLREALIRGGKHIESLSDQIGTKCGRIHDREASIEAPTGGASTGTVSCGALDLRGRRLDVAQAIAEDVMEPEVVSTHGDVFEASDVTQTLALRVTDQSGIKTSIADLKGNEVTIRRIATFPADAVRPVNPTDPVFTDFMAIRRTDPNDPFRPAFFDVMYTYTSNDGPKSGMASTDDLSNVSNQLRISRNDDADTVTDDGFEVTWDTRPFDGDWGPEDNGIYVVILSQDAFEDATGNSTGKDQIVQVLGVHIAGNAETQVSSFTVNSTEDTIDSDPGDGVAADINGNTSLRAAIMEANALPGKQKIELPAGEYVLTIEGRGGSRAETGDLDISDSLEIVGAGQTVTTINGNQIDRVFHIASGVNVVMTNLRITNGDGQQHGLSGGGIQAEASEVNLTDVAIDHNLGGAIHINGGTLTVTRTILDSNTVPNGGRGGGITADNSTVLINNSRITNNSSGTGPAIYSLNSRIRVGLPDDCGAGAPIACDAISEDAYDTVISGNTSTGAGVVLNFSGYVELNHVDISNNEARYESAVGNYGRVKIVGGRISGNRQYGGAAVGNGGVMTIRYDPKSGRGTLIEGNEANGTRQELQDGVMVTKPNGYVSAIGNSRNGRMTVERATIRRNRSSLTQAIGNGGALTVIDSTISNNSATDSPGLHNAGDGTLRIVRSTFFENVADNGGAGAIDNTGFAVLDTVTVSGNIAQSAVRNRDGGQITILDSTIVNNQSGPYGAALSAGTHNPDGAFRVEFAVIEGSVVAGNTYESPMNETPSPDVRGPVTSNGFNFIGVAVPGVSGSAEEHAGFDQPSDLFGLIETPVDPKLEELANNGGFTLTHRPRADSPLIDTGRPRLTQASDQIGNARAFDGDNNGTPLPDIGAVEFGAPEFQPGDVSIQDQSAISGRVYDDRNGNGTYDVGEALSDKVVFIDFNNNGVPDTSDADKANGTDEPTETTDAEGVYVFAGIFDTGIYRVLIAAGVNEIVRPSGTQGASNSVLTNQTDLGDNDCLHAVEILDLDGDGRQEILALNSASLANGRDCQYKASETPLVLFSQGLGNSFSTSGSAVTVHGLGSTVKPDNLITGQFFGNQRTDIAILSNEGSAKIYLVDGASYSTTTGSLRVQSTINAGSTAVDIARGKFDIDDFDDLVTVSATDGVTIWNSQDNKTIKIPLAGTVAEARSLAVGNRAGATADDIFVLTATGIDRIRRNGTQWAATTIVPTHPAGHVPYDLTVKDVNGDDIPDLFAVYKNGGSTALKTSIRVYNSVGDGDYANGDPYLVSGRVGAIVVGDVGLDESGSADIVVTVSDFVRTTDGRSRRTGLPVHVLRGLSNGKFAAETQVGFASNGPNNASTTSVPIDIKLTDLYGDSTIQLVVARGEQKGLTVLGTSGRVHNVQLDPQTPNVDGNDFVVQALRTLKDVDGDGLENALSDGILVLRRLAGFSDDALIAGTAAAGADAAAIQTHIDRYMSANDSHFDLDGDGKSEALTDGVLFIRYLAGFTGTALINNAANPAGTRKTAADIQTWFEQKNVDVRNIATQGAVPRVAAPTVPGSAQASQTNVGNPGAHVTVSVNADTMARSAHAGTPDIEIDEPDSTSHVTVDPVAVVLTQSQVDDRWSDTAFQPVSSIAPLLTDRQALVSVAGTGLLDEAFADLSLILDSPA